MISFKKALLPVLLIIALLVATVPAFAFAEGEAPATSATPSVTVKKLAKMTITNTKYNGKKQVPKVKVYDEDGKVVSSEYYKVKVTGYPKNAGTYAVKVSGKGIYTGTLTGKYVIKKIANPFWIKLGRSEIPYRQHRRSVTRLRAKGVKGKAELSDWTVSKSGVYVNGHWAYITPGFKGKVRLSITAKETKNYKATTKSVTITVK